MGAAKEGVCGLEASSAPSALSEVPRLVYISDYLSLNRSELAHSTLLFHALEILHN